MPLNAEARTALQDYLAVRPVTAADGHLFLGRRGKGLKPRMVEYLVAKYAELADFAGVSPHTLRQRPRQSLLRFRPRYVQGL